MVAAIELIGGKEDPKPATSSINSQSDSCNQSFSCIGILSIDLIIASIKLAKHHQENKIPKTKTGCTRGESAVASRTSCCKCPPEAASSESRRLSRHPARTRRPNLVVAMARPL